MSNALIEAAKEIARRSHCDWRPVAKDLSKIWGDLTSHNEVQYTPQRREVAMPLQVVATPIVEESLDDFCF